MKWVARELVWCCLDGSGTATLGFFALGVRDDLGGWWGEGEGRLVSQRTRCGCVLSMKLWYCDISDSMHGQEGTFVEDY